MDNRVSFGTSDILLSYEDNMLEMLFYAEQPEKNDADDLLMLLGDVLSQKRFSTSGRSEKNKDQQLTMVFRCNPGCNEDSVFKFIRHVFDDLETIRTKIMEERQGAAYYVDEIIDEYRRKNGLSGTTMQADNASPRPNPSPLRPEPDHTAAPAEHHITRKFREQLRVDLVNYSIPQANIEKICHRLNKGITQYNKAAACSRPLKLKDLRTALMPLVIDGLLEGECPPKLIKTTAESYVKDMLTDISNQNQGMGGFGPFS